VEDLDLPAQSIPADLLDRLLGALHLEICQQLPVDRLTPGRRINLGRVDDGEIKSRVAFLFANRWQDVDPAEADLESNPCNGIVVVANLDYMPARYLRSSHLRSHRVIAVTGKAINNSADDEVTANR